MHSQLGDVSSRSVLLDLRRMYLFFHALEDALLLINKT